jgi:hypothetical protein
MKLDLVGPMVCTNCHGLGLDLRVGVLTDVENNGTQDTRGFIHVWASVRIKILRPVCISYTMISPVETSFTPPFIG